MVSLGVIALLCLVPSIAGVVTQLLAYGSRTLLPSAEAAYPWLLALLATSLFSGFGIARRLRARTALRRHRLLGGTAIAIAADRPVGDRLRGRGRRQRRRPARCAASTPRGSVRPSGDGQPPLCDGPLTAGPIGAPRACTSTRRSISARSARSISPAAGSADDFRWLAYVASSRQLGQYGSARVGGRGVDDRAADRLAGRRPDPGRRPTRVDLQALAAALTAGYRATAEDHGIEVIEGARARRCRIAIDGPTFADAFPQISWLVGDADLHRWRGQLDYWVFLDGELGQVAGSVNGEAFGIVPDALLGTIDVRLTATERGRDSVIYPPAQ